MLQPARLGTGSAPTGTPVESYESRKGAREFLAALREYGIVSLAVQAAPFSQATAYRWRSDDPAFRKAWDDAVDVSTDRLVREAWRRASEGVKHTWTDKNGQEHTEYKYSDNLLMFLIKARRPQQYRDNATIEHTFEGPRLLVGPREIPTLPQPGPSKHEGLS